MEILIVKTPFQKKMSKEDYLASKLLALSCPNKITIYPKIHLFTRCVTKYDIQYYYINLGINLLFHVHV